MLIRATCPDCRASLKMDTPYPAKRADLVKIHKEAMECEYELRKEEDK